MVESASALPAIVGVELFVTEEDVVKEVMIGAVESEVSIVMDIDEDLDEYSYYQWQLILGEYTPSSRGEEGVIEKAPSLSVVAVPKTISPFKRVMVESASALPVIVGVELFVIRRCS